MHHRTLAASFIMTVSAVVACSSAPPPPPEVSHNPPEPPPTATIATAEPEPEVPEDDEEGPQDEELRDAPTNRRGTIDKRGDKCFWTSALPECPPETRCNPPAPTSFEVKCADENLPEAPAGVAVQTRDDGTCFYVVPRAPKHCPTGMSCNPPAPEVRNVRCASDDSCVSP